MQLPNVVSWRNRSGKLRLGFIKKLDQKKDGREVYLVTVRQGDLRTISRRRVVGAEASLDALRRAGFRPEVDKTYDAV